MIIAATKMKKEQNWILSITMIVATTTTNTRTTLLLSMTMTPEMITTETISIVNKCLTLKRVEHHLHKIVSDGNRPKIRLVITKQYIN